jgi:hypothetical protein
MRSWLTTALTISLGLWVGASPAAVSAAERGGHYLPTLVLRSTGQFITLSAEDTAVLCGPEGVPCRSFEVSYPIARLELSADDRVVRLRPAEGPGDCFDVQSGSPVPPNRFVPVAPPERPKYRVRGEPPFSGRLQTVDAATGRLGQSLSEVRYVYPPVWIAGGTADIPVGVVRGGMACVAAFRFSPITGELRELFCFPGDFEIAKHLAFDIERGVAFLTSADFETSVFDLRTGRRMAYIHHAITPAAAPLVPTARQSFFTPGTALVVVLGTAGALVLLVFGGRSLCTQIGRLTLARAPSTPEAADYCDPR